MTRFVACGVTFAAFGVVSAMARGLQSPWACSRHWAGCKTRRTDMAAENILSLIEYMPAHLRASHEAAGNRGYYPHNGAERVIVAGPVDPTDLSDWARIVREGDAEIFSDVDRAEMFAADIPADALSENDLADIDE
jgi:hypothetical protein